MKHFKSSCVASAVSLALALAAGTGWAQSSAGTGSAGSGSSAGMATGGGTAPAAQPGAGTRNSATGKSAKSEQVARGDRKFVEEAASSGMFEVQVSQLAATKATDPAIKEFASMLVDHHTKANSELMQLANAKGVEVSPAPKRALRRDMEQLGKKSGAEFDRDYVRNVGIKAHETDIKLFEKAGKELKDPELKAFAAKTLPTLQQHLAAAQKLPQAGGKGGASDPARMGAPR